MSSRHCPPTASRHRTGAGAVGRAGRDLWRRLFRRIRQRGGDGPPNPASPGRRSALSGRLAGPAQRSNARTFHGTGNGSGYHHGSPAGAANACQVRAGQGRPMAAQNREKTDGDRPAGRPGEKTADLCGEIRVEIFRVMNLLL